MLESSGIEIFLPIILKGSISYDVAVSSEFTTIRWDEEVERNWKIDPGLSAIIDALTDDKRVSLALR
jgi:hypothetical protein